MPRLPVPGADKGKWGKLLNSFLVVAHEEDGRLKPIAQRQVVNLVEALDTKAGLTDLQAKADVTALEAKADVAQLNAKADKESVYSRTQTDARLDAKYQKPSAGIPKSDLNLEVRSALDKADAALQKVTTHDIGLSNVDNTSDDDKPVSRATQAALEEKLARSDVLDTLESDAATQALSARQGRALRALISEQAAILATDDPALDNLQKISSRLKEITATLETTEQPEPIAPLIRAVARTARDTTTITANDGIIRFDSADAITQTLPTNDMPLAFTIIIKNVGTGSLTLMNRIDGQSERVLTQYDHTTLTWTGDAWEIIG